ncbi:poly(U)-specific endoribonuclease-B isoform X2 [Olea europaea subsp. europaea]|uniref:Poly(U)-specific endoribonuclease-B isoform X2 n=1 Tax=Olea europaea subsp. europaea TaxID=158383 RepID=A0A8S0V9Z6_OLEEU|nr:poly(U)-specific endoribonuclease-B isoform X2 [Olea europaea subsp. europaea]
MDDLVKGLINVAFGQGEEDDRNRDERSRSTWAQVVSGEHDDHDESISSSDRHNRHGYNRQEEEERNEEWRSGESRPTMRPPKAVHQDYDRDDDRRQDNYNQVNWNQKEGKEADDGWETVGKKPVKQHYKAHKDQWKNYKRPLDEQDYSSEVKYDFGIEPSGEELNDLSKALNKLWELDLNRLVPGKDYQIDCGEGKKVYQKEDMAEGSLFSWLSEEIFMRPTFARFCSLLDNYNPHEGYKENVTPEERQEQAAFIEEISRTAPIKYLHRYLSSKGIVSENYQDFKRMMTSLWFDLYGRGGTSGSSSAFEHVFVGEIKQHGEQEVSGFHNWLQFYLEEAKGRVNYQGYILPRRHGSIPDTETQLLTIQFEWDGVLKSVSSTLIGVSPEFEVAIYTLCFYLGREENHVELGPYPVNIKCYRLGNKIGSAFPVADC